MINLKHFTIFGGIVITILLMLTNSYQMVSAEDVVREINVYHPSEGTVEICFKGDNYDDVCDVPNLAEYQSPFVIPINVEDPSDNENYELCYEFEDRNSDGCREYEMTGKSRETVDFVLPGGSITNSPSENFNTNLQSPTNGFPPKNSGPTSCNCFTRRFNFTKSTTATTRNNVENI